MTRTDRRTGRHGAFGVGAMAERWLMVGALTILLCAALGFSPLYLNAYSDVKQGVAMWALGLLSPALILLLWFAWQRRLAVRVLVFAAGWGILVAGFAVGLRTAPNPFEGWKWWCFYSGVAVCGLTGAVVSRRYGDFVERLAWLTALMLIIISCYGLAQWLRIDPLRTMRVAGLRVELPSGYPGATFGNTNFAVQFTAPAIVLVFGLLIQCLQGRDRRALPRSVVPAVAILLGLAHLSITLSRGGLLALVVGLLVVAYFAVGGGTVRIRGISLRIPYLAAILVVIAAAGALLSGTVTRMLRDDARSVGSTAAYRLDIWHASWNMSLAAWPSGVGPGQFDIVLPRYGSERLARHGGGDYAAERVNRAHNEYLDFLAEGGVAAVGAFLLIAGSVGLAILRHRCRQDPACAGAAAAIAAIAVHAAVDFPLHSPASAVFLALLAGAVVSARGGRIREVSLRLAPPRSAVVAALLLALGLLGFLATTTPARFLISQHLGRLAVARRTAAKPMQAMEILRSAKTVASSNREISALMSAVARDTGDTTAALEAAATWVKLEPWSTSAHNALGAALAESGETTAAVKSFLTALEIAPTNHAARVNAATALYLNGQYCEAYELYRVSVRAAPRLAEGVARNYADAAIECSITTDTLELLGRYVAANPGDQEMRKKYETARQVSR
ncbi:MAG: O-antigen ligase family protein [Candidatus Sumerlaeaceae bacterium]|nr:O-antigen ligase family protein [Candidatus Sumerlaeaceae bacterium]